MTEEQIFKSRFPEYCAGERCLSPYFDLFQIGFEEGEKQNEELQEKLAGAERTRNNLVQLGFPTFQSCREYADKISYAKTIIQDLLNNSDEYARQRAMDFLKGE
jgi:FtsZ-interacting cell division protein YlmF